MATIRLLLAKNQDGARGIGIFTVTERLTTARTNTFGEPTV